MEQKENNNDKGYKRCSKCGKLKPKSEFWKDSRNEDGLQLQCKECKREYNLKRYLNRKERNPIGWWVWRTVESHTDMGYTMRDIDCIYEEAKHTKYCPICGVELIYCNDGKKSGNSASLDRIDNQKEINRDNFMIICSRCNSRKYNRSLKEYLDSIDLPIERKQELLKLAYGEKSL